MIASPPLASLTQPCTNYQASNMPQDFRQKKRKRDEDEDEDEDNGTGADGTDEVKAIILDEAGYWRELISALKLTTATVLLHLCDGNKPAMGKVYDRMFMVGEGIPKLNIPSKEKAAKIHTDRWEYLTRRCTPPATPSTRSSKPYVMSNAKTMAPATWWATGSSTAI
mmetsp:Transcript_16247/g.35241  ORF Transcript_16247/g.35241 Transcript_16247/m.35241 type:complete len:167 (-) Transcript_16247:248-748(-)